MPVIPRLSIDPCSTAPQFDPGHDEGVVQVAMNVASGHSLSSHLRAAIQRQRDLGRFVPDALIAFAEKLAAAASQAAGVLEGEDRPTDLEEIEDVEPSPAAYFDISVGDDGIIDVEMTTKMAHLLSKIFRDYRDWRAEQGFAIPRDVAAFGAEMGGLARIARPVLPARPVVQLPDEPAGSPLAKFVKPRAG